MTIAIVSLCVSAPAVGSAGSDRQLANLYSAMREHEALYSDMEVRYTSVLTGAREPPREERGDTWRRAEEEVRLVLQKPRYYAKIEYDREYYDGKQEKTISESAFDGEWSRVDSRGKVGNIVNGPVFQQAFTLPNRWGILQLKEFALVDYFQWSPALMAQKLLREEFTGARVELLGEEQIDGLRSLKVRFQMTPRDGGNNQFFHIWIVPDRNYLPARSQNYLPSASSTVPHHVVRVLAWREAAPGIWLPERCEAVLYDLEAIRKGNRVVLCRTDFALHSVGLSPSYPIEFFRDVKMATNRVVYTVVDGEIVKEVWADDDSAKGSGRTRWMWLFAIVNVAAVFVLALVWWLRRRGRRAGA